MASLVKKIQNSASQYSLWQKGARLVVGISGGPDSVCLLRVLLELKEKYNFELVLAHVNYALRGKDSLADEKFVKELAAKNKLPLEILQPQIKQKNNLENHLREVRYEFFEQVRVKYECDAIAVAHNLDDQAETFLLRMLRGAGLQGLSAMRFRTGKIIRPLLGITRAEILAYLEKKKQAFRIDKTNAENLFLRNKIRNQLLPFLEKEFNPQIKATLFAATQSIAEDGALLDQLAESEYQKGSGQSVRKILALPPALQRRLVLKLIAEQKKDLRNIEAAHVTEILKAIASTKGKQQVVLFKGLKMTRNGDKVNISLLGRNKN